MFIDITVIKNNKKENRIINVNFIRQILEYQDHEDLIKLDLSGVDGYLIVDSTLKEFKIKINQIKK